MKKEKTIIEWLEQAKKQGYEWAQSAIEQTLEQDRQYRTLSLSGALLRGFHWRSSKEGVDYWEQILINLPEKEHKANND